MQPRTLYRILLFGGLASLCGCEPPGKPKEEDRWKPPSELKNFAELFDTNCRACHSNGQTLGASIPMNNPPYLAIVPKEVVHKVVQDGIPGTAMPGFSAKAGGLLTDEQINILADDVYNWAKGHEAPTDNLPPYSAALGDADRGEAVFCPKLCQLPRIQRGRRERQSRIGGRRVVSEPRDRPIFADCGDCRST